jgi:hypothetical protein
MALLKRAKYKRCEWCGEMDAPVDNELALPDFGLDLLHLRPVYYSKARDEWHFIFDGKARFPAWPVTG